MTLVCATKIAERKSAKENLFFFHLKTFEFCVVDVPTKSAVGWNCVKLEATSLTMQRCTSPPCKFSCPTAVVAIPWNKCTNTQRLGVAKKIDSQCEIFCKKHCEKKRLHFRRNMGLKTRENLNLFYIFQTFGPGPSESHTMRRFFSLTPVSVELAVLPACDPSLSANQKSA